MPDGGAGLGPVLKAAYPKVIASLIRHLGDFDRAEDATQDAIVQALATWRATGVPENPVAWLVTVGRNRAVDGLRRTRLELTNHEIALFDAAENRAGMEADALPGVHLEDDLLRLVFVCCHPVLPEPSRVMLTLKTVLGFSVDEIARGLLTSRDRVEKRLARAKRSLRTQGIPYTVPDPGELPDRLISVQRVVYLLFNEGYSTVDDQQRYRGHLCEEAIRLARMLARLFRQDPESRSLLALMLLTSARAAARVGPDGDFVPLALQDRGRWNHTRIREGLALIDAVYVARRPPGEYQIQAAISAIHCRAADWGATDWAQIAALYAKLEALQGPRARAVTAVNRAVALAMDDRADAALELLETINTDDGMADYQPYHAALADVLSRSSAHARARAAYDRAIALSRNGIERRHLEALRARVPA